MPKNPLARRTDPGGPLDISVVIPALDAAEHIPRLLGLLELQTIRAHEVVIIDSSADRGTERVLKDWGGAIPVVFRRVDFAYPGHARNLGVALASGEWIAFLDCKTLPAEDWLERCSAAALSSGAEYVAVCRTSHGDTYFKSLLLAATYGNTAVPSLSGSMIRKEAFLRSGGFLPWVRAGEDILWMRQLAEQGVRTAEVAEPLLRYEGFPGTLGAAIRKWHAFTLSNARIDVLNVQKTLYASALTLASLLFVYRWNSIFAHWERNNVNFIPNVTKVYAFLLFLIYLLCRGLLRPLNRKVQLSFLLPFRWLAVSFVGCCLDIAKAPGLLLGALVLFRKKIALLRGATNKS